MYYTSVLYWCILSVCSIGVFYKCAGGAGAGQLEAGLPPEAGGLQGGGALRGGPGGGGEAGWLIESRVHNQMSSKS